MGWGDGQMIVYVLLCTGFAVWAIRKWQEIGRITDDNE